MLKHIKFIDNHGSFCVNRPENTSYLYFPLASEAGLKSSVTPVLGGDSKIDQDTFLSLIHISNTQQLRILRF